MKPYPVFPLSKVLAISNERIEPLNYPSQIFNYVGLENIESHTGQLLSVKPTKGSEIKSSKNIFHAGQILYGKLRPYLNKVHLANKEGICSTDIYVLNPNHDKIHPSLLTYFLRSNLVLHNIENLMQGANLPRISQDNFLGIQIPLPPLPEQERIVHLLDEAKSLQATRTRATARMEQFVPALFQEMFGNPDTNPKKWKTELLGNVANLINGAAFKPNQWEKEGLPIIRIQNLNDPSKPYNNYSKPLPEKFRVRTGDILFAWSGTPGTSFGCFRWYGTESWLNQHIFNVKIKYEIDGEFFINNLNGKLSELIAKAHGGVGLQHVTKGMVDSTKLMIPPLALQREFAARVEEARGVQSAQGKSAGRVEALYQSMLARAFAGEL